MTYAIDIRELALTLGGKAILNKASLTVEKGSVCTLLGPNGAGKTTLLKTLIHIYPHYTGHAEILGISTKNLAPLDFTRIGYVSESQELPLHMTVEAYLKMCQSLYPNWDRAWELSMAETYDLKSAYKTPLARLSRGMRVKASLISSLAYKPELLILDEPFSGLDPIVREEFISGIIELAGEVQATVLLSSHDLPEVERISDTIAVMRAGKIIIQAPLDDLITRFRAISIVLPENASTTAIPPGWELVKKKGINLSFVSAHFSPERVSTEVQSYCSDASVVSTEEMNLHDIYKALVLNEKMEG